MRIVLDLQGCQSDSRLRGIGRYSLALAKAIVASQNRHDIWILLSDLFPESVEAIRSEFSSLVSSDRIVVMALPGPASALMGFEWRASAAELIREFVISELQPDVIHISSLFEGYTTSATTSIGLLDAGPVVAVTHYDLIQHLDQETHLPDLKIREFYLRKIEMLKDADLVLAISSYTREEVISHLKLPQSKVVNISSAVNDRFFVEVSPLLGAPSVLMKYGIDKPFIMTTGIVEPRKNLEGLISAFGALSTQVRNGYQLLLVCQASPTERVRLMGLAREAGLDETQIIITGFVPDDDLITLYRSTYLFVFPSFHEGFGLPAVEAMACGAAVIGSNTTSLPEAIGNPEALFDPRSISEMSKLIERVISDQEFHQALKDRGIHHARSFSWEATASRALAAFEEACQVKRLLSKGAERTSSEPPSSLLPELIKSIGQLTSPSTESDWVAAASAIALAQRSGRKKQLLIDVSVLSGFDAKSGIQRVTRAVAVNMIDAPPAEFEVRLVEIDRNESAYRYSDNFAASLGSSFVMPEAADSWVEMRSGDVFLGLDLCADSIPAMQGYFEARRRQGVQIFFVVYDLLPVLHPEWFHHGIADVFPPWLTTIGQVSDGLICISRAVASDLHDWYLCHPPSRLSPLKIGAFHLGADIAASSPSVGLDFGSDAVIASINSRPSFLMVGTVEPRKGYKQAVDAFSLLWAKGVDVNLVIIGAPGWHQDSLIEELKSHPEIDGRLIWLRGISDQYLDYVYSASICLVAASEGEGFGLPLIEAAQKGLPLIVRDLPVFKEVAGDAAFYFKGVRPEALAEAVERWLELHASGAAPGSARIEWLTWRQSTEQLKGVLFDEKWVY